MWGRVGLAGREDGGGGGGQKDEEIGGGAREEGGEGKEGVEGGAGGGPGAAEGWKGSDLPPHQEMGQLSVQVPLTVIVNLSRN